MPIERIHGYRARILLELRRSFSEEDSPHQIAGSFALGVFITMLPTLGVGLLVFVLLSALFKWIDRIALFASVIVLNPVVKWGVYATSISLGFFLLGPVDGVTGGQISPEGGQGVLIRLIVGNVILAFIATTIAYPVVYHLAGAYQRKAAMVVEAVYQEIEEGSTPV